MGNNSSSTVFSHSHSNVLIGDEVFIWGGHRPGIPLVHDSPQKRQFTSSITVYNILQSPLDTRQTTGTPPNGAIGYSCCCVGEDIYYFGGCCEVDGCYHNNLFVLSTKSLEWREIDCDDGPMKKDSSGMIHFHIDGEDYLLVIGGRGPVPAHDTPDHYKYPPNLKNPAMCYTNEVHIMCVSSTPGKWIVPITTGSVFPPSFGFSINTLSSNKAIVFGMSMDEAISNDIFILTYSAIHNLLDNQKLVKPSDPCMPVGRFLHSGVIIPNVFSNGGSHLLVMGGLSAIGVIPDTWILSIDSMKWNKVFLPEEVSGRYGQSITCYKMSMYCFWLLVTGGATSRNKYGHTSIVELAYSPFDSDWIVSKILNKEDLKDVAQYTKLVSDRLTICKKEYQSIVNGTVPATTESGYQSIVNGTVPATTESGLTRGEGQNQKILEEMYKNLEKRDQEILEKEEIIRQKEETIRNKEKLLQDTIEQKDSEIQLKDDTIRQKDEFLQQKDSVIQSRDNIIRQKVNEIQSKEQEIHEKEHLIQQMQCSQSHSWVIQNEEVNVTKTVIGGGSYGEVRVAVFRGARVAAKLLHDLIVSKYNKDIFTKEMEISSGIHHPNIVQFIGATRLKNPILLYELMATSLHKRLQDDDKSLTHAQIVSIGSDICTAMCYLHQWKPQPIIHRDISSPNVLMEPLPNDKWRAKLSDFGSANLQMRITTKNPGNPFYSAPEADNPRHHSPAMDVYSFGVVLTEMTLHRAPELEHKQSAQKIDWTDMRVIVLKCVSNVRSQRLSSKQLLAELQKLNIK